MNRCQYSSNYSNQMMNPYGRPMQNSNSYCQTSCNPVSKPESCRQVHKPDGCRPASDSCRPMQKPDGCKPETCERPKYSREQMLQYINEVSFAVNDILLYLDTHPCDHDAMDFYKKNVTKRDAALCEFAKYYGPLTVDTAYKAKNDTWEWVMQPFPWEGGNC